jgi:cyclohexanone monooxygenase
MEYSYQFSAELEQDWEWSEKYATQPELLRYARHVADRFELRRDIEFQTRVTAAAYDEAMGRWHVETDRGARWSAQYFILATGILSTTNLPHIEGLESFEGDKFHTGKWPHEPVDFTGKRVAVIGTGSSGSQAIPVIAAQAEQLLVFQRTANYVIPAHNESLQAAAVKAIKDRYPAFRAQNKQYPFAFSFVTTNKSALEVSDEERERHYEAAWNRGGLMFLGCFTDLLLNDAANATAQGCTVKAPLPSIY